MQNIMFLKEVSEKGTIRSYIGYLKNLCGVEDNEGRN